NNDDAASAERTLANRVDRENVGNAGDGLGLGGVEFRHLAAENRTSCDHRVHQTGGASVDTKFRRACGLGPRFVSWGVVPDDGEVAGILQRYGIEVGKGKLGGVRGQLAVGEELFARTMEHAAVLRLAGVAVDIPVGGGGGDEHLASGSSGSSQRQIGTGHA